MNNSIIAIAIANPDPFAREGMLNVLNKQRNIKVVIEAYSENDLLQQLILFNSRPDIVILEADVQILHTYKTLKEIKSRYPTISVIVMSSFTNEYCILKMIKGGAKGYLVKSNNVAAELINAIKNVITDKFYCPSQMVGMLAEKLTDNQFELTNKEAELLAFYCEGCTMKEAADKMQISERTAIKHFAAVCNKLEITNKAKLIAFALKTGIVSVDNNIPLY